MSEKEIDDETSRTARRRRARAVLSFRLVRVISNSRGIIAPEIWFPTGETFFFVNDGNV